MSVLPARPSTATPAQPAAEPPAPSAVPDPVDWYKDAIVYELHVKAFLDSNGDGSGDFDGDNSPSSRRTSR